MYRFVGSVFFYHDNDTYIPKKMILIDRLTRDCHGYTASTESRLMDPRPIPQGGTLYHHPLHSLPGVAPEGVLQLIGDSSVAVRGAQQLEVFKQMGIPATDAVARHPHLFPESVKQQQMDQPPLFTTVVNGKRYLYYPVPL